MSFLSRGLFVVAGIIAGTTSLNYFVFGNTADYGLPNARLGAWREAKVRPACSGALEFPQKDYANPKMPSGPHRVDAQDFMRMVDMTAALHCYLVTQRNAVCEPNNRAYVVDYAEKYFAKMDEMLATAKRYGEDEVRNVHQLWDSQNNRAIMSAFDEHIRHGRLMRSDFGMTAPRPLQVMFDRTQKPSDSCGKERPWVASKV